MVHKGCIRYIILSFDRNVMLVFVNQNEVFKRINKMNLKAPLLVGFGISNQETCRVATENSDGAIIGSAYINCLKSSGIKATKKFIEGLR